LLVKKVSESHEVNEWNAFVLKEKLKTKLIMWNKKVFRGGEGVELSE